MKKVLLVGLFALLTTTMTQAQFSVQGGLNNVTVKLDIGEFGSVSDSELGFFLGAGYQFDLGESFYLEPAILFSIVSDLTSMYVPFIFKYDVAEGFKVTGGPQLNILLEEGVEDGKTGVDLALGGEYTFAEGWFAFARYAFQVSRGGDFGEVTDINTFTLGVGKKFN